MKHIYALCSIFVFLALITSCSIGESGPCGDYNSIQGTWMDPDREYPLLIFPQSGTKGEYILKYEDFTDVNGVVQPNETLCTYEVFDCETGEILFECDGQSGTDFIRVINEDRLSVGDDVFHRV